MDEIISINLQAHKSAINIGLAPSAFSKPQFSSVITPSSIAQIKPTSLSIPCGKYLFKVFHCNDKFIGKIT